MSDQPAMRVRAWRELMHVHSAVTSAIDIALRANVGIPGDWYEALVEIAFAGGTMRMNEFAAEATLTKSGATRFVDRLERAGLVERSVCPTDRRSWQLDLTAKGKEIQRAADPHVLAVLDEHFGGLMTDDQALSLYETLHRVRTAPVSA